jgi:hypothetical protein
MESTSVEVRVNSKRLVRNAKRLKRAATSSGAVLRAIEADEIPTHRSKFKLR